MDQYTFNNIKCLNFQCYSPEEIKRLSVLEITNLEILDCLGNSAPGGLYDLRLGPNERDDVCQTCKLNTFTCAGHPGHITLPVPVYNPVFFPDLYKLLRGSCFNCHRLVAPPVAQLLVLYQLQALDYGLVSTVQDLAEIVTDPSVETVSTDDYLHVVREKLERKFLEATKDAKSEGRRDPVKSVVECRRGILKNFTRSHMMGASGKCPHCRIPPRKLARFNLRLVYKDIKSSGNLSSEVCNRELTPEEAMKHLQLLWENDKTILQHLYKTMFRKEAADSSAPIQMFFMSVLIVPPSRFRRMNMLHGRKYADAQTLLYNEILKDNHNIRLIMRKMAKIDISDNDKLAIQKIAGKTDSEKYSNACQQLQRHVTEIFDSDINKEKNKISKGIKQILEKKEGLFRMNMMGKRVNSAARSVISPDPYIMVNEIGIPMVFAKKLTFPEPVNHANLLNLSRAVMNGPDVHPGASVVEMEDGRRVRLTAEDPVKRQAIANTLLTPLTNKNIIGGVKIVHRHLKNGDMLLLNRQPTLHKPSIMAHKARVLPGEKTLRLHYSNCKSYNADFDGDEMNCHFPQSYHGQAECRHIVGVNHQYLVPKDGTPLGGLIQDHIIAAVLLTVRGRFFEKEDYHQLIYSAMSFHTKRIKLLPPTILKPEMLWSGKQIVSTIIINLIPEGKPPPTLEGKAKVSSKNWKNAPAREWLAGGDLLVGDSMSESEVVIRHGELLCGVIDKAQIGPTPYSLIHMCYELYGGETSSTLLTALARLFTHHLQYFAGFSLGIEDIVVNENPNRKRRRILRRAGHAGLVATARAIEVDNPEEPDPEELLTKYREVHFNRDDTGLKVLDMEMKKVTHSLNNDINQVCIPGGLRKKFPQNNLQLMIESGAKGSSVNAMQISCLLGQIELEGRRMPLMKNGSTLPSFLPYDTSPGAGGFVGGRFLTGINPKEYFFHCMAGREGLIDTAVKTSRSGYLQRCLIKHLEGIKVNYDLTVRDSDGTVIQFLYGEDGMDPLKMQILKNGRLHLLGANYKAAINKSEVEILKNLPDVDVDHIDKQKKKIRKWKKRNPNSKRNRKSLITELDYKPGGGDGLKNRINQIMEVTRSFDDHIKKDFERSIRKCPDPVNSKYRPDLAISSICEKLDSIISDYVTDNPHKLIWKEKQQKRKYRLSTEQFKDLCYYRSMRSLVDPGETVGLLAAQSIGEPSTQMTLNTFHFAGKGEMNVTLGIPRIREILMTANTNTPTMDLPLLSNIPNREKEAERLRLKLAPVALKDVLEFVKVVEQRSVPKREYFVFGKTRSRDYTIRMSFLKHSEYKEFKNTSPSKILTYIEKVFIKRLIEALKKKIKISSSSKLVDILRDSSSGVGGFFKSENVSNEADEDNPPPTASKDLKADDGGDSSAESEGEGDTTSAKVKNSHNDEQEYDDPEDEEKTPETDEESDDEEKAVNIKEEVMSSQEEMNEDLVTRQQDRKKYKKKIISDDEKKDRITYVQGIQTWVADYDFDTIGERWCEFTLKVDLNTISIDMKSLLEEEIAKANIHAVSQIKGAFLVKNEDAKQGSDLMIKTDGVNFLEIFKYVDILDINKVYSNNIQEIAKIYGIEAAANAIKKEIVGVFAAYGIEVDARHLSLVSDYMTCSGYYRPCNRLGMEGQASPLQQMTFETSKNFMVDAMFMGTGDTMKSPSANIITGQMYHGGTGSFDINIDCRSMS